MWIQDFLVPDLQPYNIRILTYGYDSRLPGSTSNAGISEFAQGFLHSFCNARQSENVRPPYSLGTKILFIIDKNLFINLFIGMFRNPHDLLFLSVTA